jgi:hypothetical protein
MHVRSRHVMVTHLMAMYVAVRQVIVIIVRIRHGMERNLMVSYVSIMYVGESNGRESHVRKLILGFNTSKGNSYY